MIRCVVRGHRVHHAVIGFLLVWHDRHDWRRWIPDLIRYRP